ncbi:MAG: hypothetical protein B1H08_05790 [Candidatus Omnitrophica bacterium 4484_171]|nr:MAG: hypothetical protein B1H08_05790 [Candidatus Omnitrophica bacterium 4484_171]
MKYIYFLQSRKYNKYIYVGLTNNLKRRFSEHNSDKSKLSTAPYRPFTLIGYIALKVESKARELEQYFKSGSGRAFLKKRILPGEAQRA